MNDAGLNPLVERGLEPASAAAVEAVVAAIRVCGEHLQTLGIAVRPWPSEAEARAKARTLGGRLDRVVEGIRFYGDVLGTVATGVREGLFLVRSDLLNRELYKAFLFKSKLRPSGSYTEHFRDGDIVEIYDESMVQVYRNLEFFKHCSYTLSDLLFNEWYELYDRPFAVTQQLMVYAHQVLTGTTDLIHVEDNTHVLREIASDSRGAFTIRHKIVGGLVDRGGRPNAVLATLHAAPLA